MKIVYNNWLGGLAGKDRGAPANQYAEGKDIDVHREPGYLMPGYTATIVTKSDDTPAIIRGLIRDIVTDPATNDAYLIEGSDLYHITSLENDTFNANFDGSSHYYKAITSAVDSDNCALAIYPTKIGGATAVNKLFYAYDVAASGNVGMYDLTSAFDDDWMSTVPTGAVALAKAPHPMLEWNGLLYIGNGRYLASFEGEEGDNGTLIPQALPLSHGWEITALFSTKNYIGICAWKKQTVGATIRTESSVFLWDGTATDPNQIIPIEDNKITAAFNNNGLVYLWTFGREPSAVLRNLSGEGAPKIQSLTHKIVGTEQNFRGPSYNGVDSFNNRVIFSGTDGNTTVYDSIFSYGREKIGDPYSLTLPWGGTQTLNSQIGAVKTVMRNKVYAGANDGTLYYLYKFNTGASTNALYKGQYFEPDQKVRINYVKYYFKPLVASDDVTPTIETDYGTSNTLRDPSSNSNISFTNDGAVASKKFNVNIDCESFRPVLDWTAGAVAFSKIVFDFDYLPDV